MYWASHPGELIVAGETLQHTGQSKLPMTLVEGAVKGEAPQCTGQRHIPTRCDMAAILDSSRSKLHYAKISLHQLEPSPGFVKVDKTGSNHHSFLSSEECTVQTTEILYPTTVSKANR